jgi:hypothetical protein
MPISKRCQEIVNRLRLKIACPARLSKNGNLVNHNLRASCEACFLEEEITTTAKYPDENGSNRKLCAKHARQFGTHFVRDPCEKCPSHAKLQASCPNEFGKLYKLCVTHAKEVGSNTIRNPCRECPEDAKLHSIFPDEFGNTFMLCTSHAKQFGTFIILDPCTRCPTDAKLRSIYPDEFGNAKSLCTSHAKEAGTYFIISPCRDCPLDDKLHASYKDESGNSNILCSEHAKIIGTFILKYPCRDCGDDSKTESIFPDEFGNSNMLCSKHSKIVGSHFVFNPCRDCDPNEKLSAGFADEFGNSNKLCSKHAYILGLIPKPIFGCSRIACEVWDKLEVELGIKLQHAHYSLVCDYPSRQDEYKIPNTNYSVDAFDKENKVIYEYLGNFVHGYPPNHKKFDDYSYFKKEYYSTMHYETIDRIRIITELTGFAVKYIWGHEYDEIKRSSRSLMSIMHELKIIPE